MRNLTAVRPKVWLMLAGSLVILLAAGRLWLIPAHVSLDPNEGWNAFQTAHALGAAPLYPAPDSLIGNNYPPLSFYLVGWASRLLGDVIVSGRIVSLLSTLVLAAGIFLAARRFTAPDTLSPAIGALMFLGFNVTLFRSYFGMDDPQWLALALMALGLVALLPDRDAAPAAPAVLAAATLMLLGGMVKHNLLAFPLATTLWLALHHRRALAIWTGAAALSLLVAATLCYRAYGGDFFADLLAANRHYSLTRMLLKSAPIIAASAPLLMMSAGLAHSRKHDRRLDLLLLAVAISVPFGILERSGQGVDRNAHFEALIALCIAGVVALDRAGFVPGQRLRSRSFRWLMLPFIFLTPIALLADAKEFSNRQRSEASGQAMIDHIAATPGRVACETQALCYWAGKNFEIDFFLYGQRMAARHDATLLQAAIDEGRFAAIELDAAPDRAGRPGEVDNPILAMVGGHYRRVFADDDGRLLYEPTP
jgi:hypothetical protein